MLPWKFHWPKVRVYLQTWRAQHAGFPLRSPKKTQSWGAHSRRPAWQPATEISLPGEARPSLCLDFTTADKHTLFRLVCPARREDNVDVGHGRSAPILGAGDQMWPQANAARTVVPTGGSAPGPHGVSGGPWGMDGPGEWRATFGNSRAKAMRATWGGSRMGLQLMGEVRGLMHGVIRRRASRGGTSWRLQ